MPFSAYAVAGSDRSRTHVRPGALPNTAPTLSARSGADTEAGTAPPSLTSSTSTIGIARR